MASYEIGYRKPPASGRFRGGVSGNPKGRPKRRPTLLAERIKSVLNAPIEYRERGKNKVATYRELSLKMLVDKAIGGDLDAAELALKILARAERYSDPGVDPILVENWMADYPHVDPVVALEADQRRVEHRRERLARLGLADAGLALEQQRLGQAQAEEHRRRESLVDEVIDSGQALGQHLDVGYELPDLVGGLAGDPGHAACWRSNACLHPSPQK